jgi:hypothetical protein
VADPNNYNLLAGSLMFVAAGVALCFGKVPSREGLYSRAKQPNRFWIVITIYFASGTGAIGLYLYQAHWLWR